MERVESESTISASLEVTSLPEGLRVRGATYELLFDAGRPYVRLADHADNQYAELSLLGGVDTTDNTDETLELPTVTHEQDDDVMRVRCASTSTAWEQKQQVWLCRPDSIEVYYELHGKGNVTDCHFFAGHYADETMSGRFVSGTEFKSVFNPEPTTSEQAVHAAAQSSAIDVTGLSRAGREDWFSTPAPYCFGASLQPPDKNGRMPDGPWLMMGVAAPVDEQHFMGVHYDGKDRAFSVRLDYEGQTAVDGTFRSPSLLLHFADDPYAGVADYSQQLRARDLLPADKGTTSQFDWWKQPIFCGWGAQAELADADAAQKAQDFARQDVYDQFLATLDEHSLQPGTITIDDKWQTTYGGNEVDTDKWPDLADWIERRHSLGQKVLLWLKAWDHEGLPDDLCVTTQTGKPVTVDPSHPDYQDLLRQQIETMLGSDGYNADGFKIDFTARTPSGRSLQRHDKQWGTSLLHRYLQTIYDQAKTTKSDALIVTQTPNATFADVTDMIRLNDINCGAPVVEQMQHRAKVSQAACPDLLIDTDNWPMPNIEQWRKYLRVQSKLGISALYFTSTVAGQPLESADYRAIERSWRTLRKKNGLSPLLPQPFTNQQVS